LRSLFLEFNKFLVETASLSIFRQLAEAAGIKGWLLPKWSVPTGSSNGLSDKIHGVDPGMIVSVSQSFSESGKTKMRTKWFWRRQAK
jgi:hypothetical protein